MGKKTNFFLYVFCVQILPYVGEELVSVRVEPCSPAVNQERKEVLEVCSCFVLSQEIIHIYFFCAEEHLVKIAVSSNIATKLLGLLFISIVCFKTLK